MSKSYKCIVIDDNPQCVSALKQLLENYFPQMDFMGHAHSVKEGLALINSIEPDVVFLDVEMPQEDGTKLFDYLEDPNFETIFTTSFEDYAATAFRLNSIDYLVKPIKPSELREAIRRVKEKDKPSSESKVESKDQNVRITFQGVHNIEVFNVSEILYCKAENNYTTIYSKNKKATASKTLMYYESLLQSYGFFRVNRAYLINMQYVDGVDKSLNGEVILTDATRIPISGRRKKAFMEVLNNYLEH